MLLASRQGLAQGHTANCEGWLGLWISSSSQETFGKETHSLIH